MGMTSGEGQRSLRKNGMHKGFRRMTLHHTGKHSAAEKVPDEHHSRDLRLMSTGSSQTGGSYQTDEDSYGSAGDFANPDWSKFLSESGRDAQKRRSREDATASAVAQDEDRSVDIHSTFDSLEEQDNADMEDAEEAGAF